jgi:kumamolisin
MALTPSQRLVCERIINVFETGSIRGDYGNISIFHDGPHRIRQVTYGRAQTTEYGNLRELVDMYVNAGGLFSSQLAPFVPLIGRTALVDNDEFKTLLHRAGREDPVMAQTQDVFFERRYFQPALKWANDNGFSLPLAMLVIYDSFIHSGGILDFLRSRFPEQPPARGGDERTWISQYVEVRNDWLATNSNPALHPTVYRTQCFAREIARQNWDLSQLPIVAHGVPIDDRLAAAGGARAAPMTPQPSFHRVPPGIVERKCTPYFNRYDSRAAARSGAPAIRWTVPDLCTAYNWPTNLVGGGIIAMVELDGGWVQSDMGAFFNSIGQPLPQITDISVDGTQNNPNQHVGEQQDPDIEVALDIQVAAAAYYVATGNPATIRVYWASNSDPGAIAAAVRAATTDSCDVCSISWGSDEANWKAWGQQVGRDLIADMEAAANAATQAGMIVLAASGDNDSSDGGPDPANVDIPSACPHVIGCGGTSKTPTSEVVWNDDPGRTDGEGTGGGYSTVFPPQSFQVGAPYPPQYLLGGQPPGDGRMIPDIAANADPNTGYWMFVHGHQIPMGGTSAVAPLYAGLFAAFGKGLGFITPQLWANQTCFNDITQGENGAYQALGGPDPCTGIGSPIGARLSALFDAPASPSPTPAARPATVPVGWSGAITYSYHNGVLSAAPEIVTRAAALITPRAAAGTVTVHQGHRYSATVILMGLEQLASNPTVTDRLTQIGFRDVTVTGAGGTRQARGLWTGPDTTVQLDPHLTNVIDLG